MYEGLVVVKREGPSQTKKGSTGTIVLTKRRLPNRDIAQIFDEREDISTSFSLSIAMNLALNAHFDPKLRDRDLIKKNTDC